MGAKAQEMHSTSSYTYHSIGSRVERGRFSTSATYPYRSYHKPIVSPISSYRTSRQLSRPLYRERSTRMSIPRQSMVRSFTSSLGSGGGDDDWDAPGSWGDPNGGVGVDDDWTTPGSWGDPNGAITPDDDWDLPGIWDDPGYGFSQDLDWDTPNSWENPYYVEPTPIGDCYIILLFALLYLIGRVCVKKKLE